MASILIVGDQHEGSFKKSNRGVVTFARELGEELDEGFDIVVMGKGASDAAKDAAAFGAEKVYVVEGAAFDDYLAGPYATAIAALVEDKEYEFVLGSTSTFAKDCLPRVAAKVEGGMVTDCVGLGGDDELLFKRPMYAGNVIASVRVTTETAVITVRTSEFDQAEPGDAKSPVESLTLDGGDYGARFVKFDATISERPELTDADVVVSGGRGLKDADGFKSILEPLADLLGAAIGATRAAVDSGFCPNDLQVGQTGKVVAPKLYIGIAMSGAIQHLAGMKNSKVIVAINKDEEAPIFQVSDYGLVADAFKAVPELTEKLKAIL